MHLPHIAQHFTATEAEGRYGVPSGKYTYPEQGEDFKAFVQPRTSSDSNEGTSREVSYHSYVAFVAKLPEGFSSRSRITWEGYLFEVDGHKLYDAGPGKRYFSIELKEARNG